MVDVYNKFNGISDEQWYKLLVSSISDSTQEGCQLPDFPEKSFQERFTGRSGEEALFQAWQFYKRITYYAAKENVTIGRDSKICDFACGWGRITRFFLKDTIASNIYGLDVMEKAIDICRETILGPRFDVIPPTPPYPFADQEFDLLAAFSLFSHLSEPTAYKIINEFHRLLKPGGLVIITSRGKTFMNHCENIRGLDEANLSDYQKKLCQCFPDISLDKERYDRGQFLFYQCSGGGITGKTVYGEAALPYQWIEQKFKGLFSICGVESEERATDMGQVLIALKKVNHA